MSFTEPGVAAAAIVTSQASLVDGQLTIVGSGAVPDSTSRSMTACPRAGGRQRRLLDHRQRFQRAELRGDALGRFGVGGGDLVGLHGDDRGATAGPRPPIAGRAAAGRPGDGAVCAVVAAAGDGAGSQLPMAGEHQAQLHARSS